jgi:hypothetical protein
LRWVTVVKLIRISQAQVAIMPRLSSLAPRVLDHPDIEIAHVTETAVASAE